MDRIETSAELDFLSRPSYRHDDASHSISRAAASRRDKTIDDRRHGNMEECLRQLILAESASLCTGTTSSPCLSPPPRRDDASSLYLSRRAPPASSRCTNDTHTHTHTHTIRPGYSSIHLLHQEVWLIYSRMRWPEGIALDFTYIKSTNGCSLPPSY